MLVPLSLLISTNLDTPGRLSITILLIDEVPKPYWGFFSRGSLNSQVARDILFDTNYLQHQRTMLEYISYLLPQADC